MTWLNRKEPSATSETDEVVLPELGSIRYSDFRVLIFGIAGIP